MNESISDLHPPTELETKRPWNVYFTPLQWVLFGLSIGLGLLLRWLLLDMRPYHHDESLHGMYGRYFFDFPEAHYYRYDPMLHGPMLYNTMRGIFSSFGSTDWAARTPVALMGSLFLLMPWLFRRYMMPISTLALTAAIAVSPTLVYWSRFLREDFWVISFLLLALYGVTIAPKRWAGFWVLIAFTLQWCTKANVFVTLAILLGYLVFECFVRNIVLKEGPSMIERLFKNLISYPRELALGAAVSTLVFCWFYSAGFRYPEGFAQGFYKGVVYWLDQHNKERIEGPFNFHIYQLSWYELPFIIAFLTQIFFFIKSTSSLLKGTSILIGILMLLTIGLHLNGLQVQDFFLWKLLKLKDVLDVAGFFVLFFYAPLITTHHLLRREYKLAFFAYYFSASFFTYSYLGEKVPWLSNYPFIGGLIYLTLYYEDLIVKSRFDGRNFSIGRALGFLGFLASALGLIFVIEDSRPFVLSFSKDQPLGENAYFLFGGLMLIALWGCDKLSPFLGRFNLWAALPTVVAIFMVRAAIQTNFVYAGKDNEYISQVHTTYDIAEAAKRIKAEILFEQQMYRPQVLVTGESTWPLTWYFRDVPEYKFSATAAEKQNFTYIFQDFKETPTAEDIPAGYRARKPPCDRTPHFFEL